jgi:protocatechuate 3,4-dioxygenase beta subunit
MNAIILLLCAVLRIASAAEPGERLLRTGKVFGPDGKPLAGIEMRAWHTDAQGLYRRDRGDGPPRLQGTLRTAADGSYAIDTIKPGLYPGTKSGAHMHFKIGDRNETIFFDGASAIPLTRDAHGVLHGTHDFHLREGAK